jgi:DNA polymerase III subunit epsilon
VSFLRNATEYLLGGPAVGGASEARLRRWMALPEADLALPHVRAHYVVVDTETSGGDARRARLIAIGAVGVRQARIGLGDCFTTALRPAHAAADGAAATKAPGAIAAAGEVPPAVRLLDYLDQTGKAPLVAFDAAFTRKVIEREIKSTLGVPLQQPWIDLGALLPALFPEARCATRAEWLDRFGLAAGAWNDALGDAFVTAQVFLAVLDAAAGAGMTNGAQLIRHRRVAR